MFAIVYDACGLAGPIEPVEVIAIYGSGLATSSSGPPLSKGVNELEDTHVLINGVAVRLLHASIGKVSAVVPDDIGSTGTATIQVLWNGLETETLTSAGAIRSIESTLTYRSRPR